MRRQCGVAVLPSSEFQTAVGARDLILVLRRWSGEETGLPRENRTDLHDSLLQQQTLLLEVRTKDQKNVIYRFM